MPCFTRCRFYTGNLCYTHQRHV